MNLTLVSRNRGLALKATTASCMSTTQVPKGDGDDSPATAPAIPTGCFIGLMRCRVQSYQPAEVLSRQVHSSWWRRRLTAIAGLVFRCRPAAVLRRVRAVVVFSFDAVLRRRSWPHVSEERRKIGPPACADVNASASIAVIPSFVRVVAPALDTRPDPVLGCELPVAGRTVRTTPCASQFVRQAPTTACLPVLQCSQSDDRLLPAVTTATPVRNRAMWARLSTQHKQACKSPSGKIYQFWHGRTIS